jgi:hypothetical protein
MRLSAGKTYPKAPISLNDKAGGRYGREMSMVVRGYDDCEPS